MFVPTNIYSITATLRVSIWGYEHPFNQII